MTKAIPQVILLFPRKVLSTKPDIHGEGKSCCSDKVYVKPFGEIEVRRLLDVWNDSEDLPTF